YSSSFGTCVVTAPSARVLPYLSYHCRLFFTATAPTAIYTLSLHDALPICQAVHAADSPQRRHLCRSMRRHRALDHVGNRRERQADRKSTRLNSSHEWSSYAVFCLKKKRNKNVQVYIQQH